VHTAPLPAHLHAPPATLPLPQYDNAVAPLRYLALCFFSLKEIDRNQKHDDVTAMDAYGSFYEQ
jgi:hypothetical protein